MLAVVRRAADLSHPAEPGDRVTAVTADLTRPGDIDALIGEARPEACVHLAWYAAPAAYLHAAPENLACLGATADLVGRLAAAGCRRFVGAGTCLELDADAGYLAPGSPPGPRSIYAAAKHAAHVLTAQLCRARGSRSPGPASSTCTGRARTRAGSCRTWPGRCSGAGGSSWTRATRCATTSTSGTSPRRSRTCSTARRRGPSTWAAAGR